MLFCTILTELLLGAIAFRKSWKGELIQNKGGKYLDGTVIEADKQELLKDPL